MKQHFSISVNHYNHFAQRRSLPVLDVWQGESLYSLNMCYCQTENHHQVLNQQYGSYIFTENLPF